MHMQAALVLGEMYLGGDTPGVAQVFKRVIQLARFVVTHAPDPHESDAQMMTFHYLECLNSNFDPLDSLPCLQNHLWRLIAGLWTCAHLF